MGCRKGPLLFLLFINDLDDGIVNRLLKFADDTKLYDVVSCRADYLQLQKDLVTLVEWANTSFMEFNVLKCRLEGATVSSISTWGSEVAVG